MSDDIGPDELAFCCALARQCFINEYVYVCGDEEAEKVEQMRNAFAADHDMPLLQIAVSAAYGSLGKLPSAQSLAARTWPEPIDKLFEQQVREPLEENRLAAALPRLTTIEDDVSRKVREQYEENPYPRWIDMPGEVTRLGIEQYLRGNLPLARLSDVSNAADVDILIAGCGTGQHSIEIARQFSGARVLAVDISLSSLSYAKRKSTALGVANIDYAHADILELGALKRNFDLIESAGVLHHLADPMKGWRVLVSCLRPGGVMFVALYSELARQDIVAVRNFIAERAYGTSAGDIRRCRQELMACAEGTPQRNVTQSQDFFSASECRDLLFHAQEHRLTLPQIEAFLTENRLEFLGFEVDPHLRRRYAEAYPKDVAMIDLGCWHQFETANPHTFVGMYQFWVRKPRA